MISLNSNLSIVLSGSNTEQIRQLLPQYVQPEIVGSQRAAKKYLRANDVQMLVLGVSDGDSAEQARLLCHYVRDGLADATMKIVLFAEESLPLDEVTWLEVHQVNSCQTLSALRTQINRSVLQREFDACMGLQQERRQREAETNLLMAVTRFSRMGDRMEQLTQQFAQSLGQYCYTPLCFEARVDEASSIQVQVAYTAEGSAPEVTGDALLQLERLARQSFSQKSPQIKLLPDDVDFKLLERRVGAPIGGYLAFPLVVYGKVLKVLICLIPAQSMDRVSMHQVAVMSKAAEQLQILLERRSAENQLKKQYLRLRKALVELNQTREQLTHTEKMASVGQLAAGIAHEINNPLSFVLGNFRPMDEYLDTMMRMLELHSEFMQVIDIENDTRGHLLRTQIAEFEQQSDLAFIYDDIRSIVDESREGLMRVKDIISDLNSFSRKETLEATAFKLRVLVEQTLRILKYELGQNLSLEVSVDDDLEVFGHRGFVQQVLTNLIKNAAQAMREAEVTNPLLIVAAQPEVDSVKVRVRDNGPGIPAADLKRIFEPFYTTKEVGKGTGLGLSVTYNLVQKMGGELSVSSEKGVFTEFTLTLPVSVSVPVS